MDSSTQVELLKMKLEWLDKQMDKIMVEAATYPFAGQTTKCITQSIESLIKLMRAL